MIQRNPDHIWTSLVIDTHQHPEKSTHTSEKNFKHETNDHKKARVIMTVTAHRPERHACSSLAQLPLLDHDWFNLTQSASADLVFLSWRLDLRTGAFLNEVPTIRWKKKAWKHTRTHVCSHAGTHAPPSTHTHTHAHAHTPPPHTHTHTRAHTQLICNM